MSALELKNLTKSFGTNKILNEISLTVNTGEFLVLVGPSGCGKSTLLRSIAGLESLTSGDVFINGENKTNVEPQNRDLAMVFQSYALYPHMNVFENMAFSLRIQKHSQQEINSRVNEIAELLKINDLLERKPKALSGGQRQRVSLGRALVRRTPIILFDEPLSNLDAHLRNQMRVEIKKIHEHLKTTIVYVTHDQTEAMTMGDRIAILNKGKIEQIDTPFNVYRHPKNLFVANFIGTPEMNFLTGKIIDDTFEHKNFKLKLTLKLKNESKDNNKDFILGIRPEILSLSKEPTAIYGTTSFFENLGPNGLLHVDIGGEIVKLFTSGQDVPKLNEKVYLNIDQSKMVIFDKATKNLMDCL